MKCIADQYLTYAQNQIKKYLKMAYGSKYNKEIIEEYMKTYINARYYNIVNTNKPARAFYLRILDEIEYKKNILLEKNEKDTLDSTEREEKRVMIESINNVFPYILFYDEVRDVNNFKTIKNLKEITQRMLETINKDYEIKYGNIDIAEEITKQVKKDKDEKEMYLENFQTDEFIIELERCEEKEDTYIVKLDYQIKMPSQYSESAIDKVYSEGIVAEDKLAVEYILLTIVSLRDIIEGNFEDKYIAEFTSSIFKKQAKFASTLDWLDNQVIQEKVSINIDYEDYIKNQKLILEYTRKGFSFVITLDGTVKTIEEVEKLKMFKIVIAQKKLAIYKELKQNKQLFNNVIFR